MSGWYWLIGQLPFDWAHFAFMQNALAAILLVSPLFALLGCLVVNNQMAFFSEAIGHAALTGIAVGVVAGLGNPLWSMVGFAILLAIAISVLRNFSAASTDTIIGLVMAFTMALGVVLLSRGGGFAKYSRYLIGDILTIRAAEVKWVGLLLAAILAAWAVLFNRMLLTFLNRPLAKSRGVNVWMTETIFAVIVALVVTVTIPWIGLLVINSMLILPAAASRNVAGNMARYQAGAVLISMVSGVAGLVCSFYWGTAAGATIVLFAMGFFLVSLALKGR
jgi:zinc transport system permease protein